MYEAGKFGYLDKPEFNAYEVALSITKPKKKKWKS